MSLCRLVEDGLGPEAGALCVAENILLLTIYYYYYYYYCYY